MSNSTADIAITFLKSLDIYRPVFCLTLKTIDEALYIFKRLSGPSEIPLHKFVTTEANVRIYFPNCLDAVEILIQCLKEVGQDGKAYIRLLDILIVITTMAFGTLLEKSQYYYRWFHVSGYELMSEIELSLFIVRFSSCVSKMKVIGRLDITEEDAKHEAFRARVNKIDGKLLPGLNFEHFYRWLSERPESIAFTKFRLLFDKLIKLLDFIKDRAVNVLELLESKQSYSEKHSGGAVPMLDIDARQKGRYTDGSEMYCEMPLQIQSKCHRVYIIEKFTGGVFTYLPMAVTNQFIEDIYVKREEIRPYNYVAELSNRLNPSPDGASKECKQYMNFTSYQHINIVKDSCYSKVGVKLYIDKLLPGMKYVLTYYTLDNSVLGKTEVVTLPSIDMNGRVESEPESVEVDLEHSYSKGFLFPNSFSSSRVQEYLLNSTQFSVEKTDILVFTGPVCSLLDAIPLNSIFAVTGINPGVGGVFSNAGADDAEAAAQPNDRENEVLFTNNNQRIGSNSSSIPCGSAHSGENSSSSISGFMSHPLGNKLNQSAIAQTLLSIFDKYCYYNWNDLVYHLCSLVGSPDVLKENLLPSSSTKCQVLQYPCDTLVHQIDELVTKLIPLDCFVDEKNRSEFIVLLKEQLDSVYYSYCYPLHSAFSMPPHAKEVKVKSPSYKSCRYRLNNINLYMLRQNQTSPNRSCSASGMTVEQLLEDIDDHILNSRLYMKSEVCNEVPLPDADCNDLCNHMILTVGCIDDLLLDEAYASWKNASDLPKHDVVETESVVVENTSEQKSSMPAPDRGKWEIMHGESSENAYTKMNPELVDAERHPEVNMTQCGARSHVFIQLLEKLFKWLECGDDISFSSCSGGSVKSKKDYEKRRRKVTIVSCGWQQGYNFTIRRKRANVGPSKHNKHTSKFADISMDAAEDDSEYYDIRHECLLPTSLDGSVAYDTDRTKGRVDGIGFDSMASKDSVLLHDKFEVDYQAKDHSKAIMMHMQALLLGTESCAGQKADSMSLRIDGGTDCERVFAFLNSTLNFKEFGDVVVYEANLIPMVNGEAVPNSTSTNAATELAVPTPPATATGKRKKPKKSFSFSEEILDKSPKNAVSNSRPGSTPGSRPGSRSGTPHQKVTYPPQITSTVHVYRGPKIEHLTSNDVYISLVAKGVGCFTCTIYDIPMNMTYSDALSFLLVEEERKLLRPVGRRKRRCYLSRQHQTIVFHFGLLKPYSAYSIVIEPTMNELPLVLYFHTLPILQIQPVKGQQNLEIVEGADAIQSPKKPDAAGAAVPVSCVLASVVTEDLILPSYKARLVGKNFTESLRPFACSIYLVNGIDPVSNSYRRGQRGNLSRKITPTSFQPDAAYTENASPAALYSAESIANNDIDMLNLSRHVHIVGKFLPENESVLSHRDCFNKYTTQPKQHQMNFKYISFEIVGTCIRLYPKYDCLEAIYQLSEAIVYVDKYHLEINSILIILHKPLVHFYYMDPTAKTKTSSGTRNAKWDCQVTCPLVDPAQRLAYIKLLTTMFDWKIKYVTYTGGVDNTRDCYIVTVLNVKNPKCVVFQKSDTAFTIDEAMHDVDDDESEGDIYNSSPELSHSPGRSRTASNINNSFQKSFSRQNSFRPGKSFARHESFKSFNTDDMSELVSKGDMSLHIDPFTSGSVRHLILPCHYSESSEINRFVFPPSDTTLPLGYNTNIYYELSEMSYDTFSFGCECTSPRLDLHSHSMREYNEPVTYLFDVLPRNTSSSTTSDNTSKPGEDSVTSSQERMPTPQTPKTGRTIATSRTGAIEEEGEGDASVVMIDGPAADSMSGDHVEPLGYAISNDDDDISNKTYVTSGHFHLLIARTVVNDYDHFDFMLGPMVGYVTNTTAKIIIEVNRDLKSLLITLRPRGTLGKTVELRKKDIKAFEITTFNFSGLTSGVRYDVLVPEFRNDITKSLPQSVIDNGFSSLFASGAGAGRLSKPGVDPSRAAKGSFRTKTDDCLFVQLAFTGLNGYANETDMINFVVRQLNSQQGVNMDLLAVQKHLLSYLTNHTDSGNLSVISDNSWKWLSDHLNLPFTPSSQIVHLGDHTLLPLIVSQVISALVGHASCLELPLDQASGVSSYYFQQFDEIVKDTFRLFGTIPSIQSTFCSGHHSPAFHSSYQLPIKIMPKPDGDVVLLGPDGEEVGLNNLSNSAVYSKEAREFLSSGIESVSNEKLVLLIKRIFESNMQSYIMSLVKDESPDYIPPTAEEIAAAEAAAKANKTRPTSAVEKEDQATPVLAAQEASHFSKVWRYGSIVIVVFDIVSGRKKAPKKKGNASKVKTASGMSLGFLDRAQWVLLKNIMKDISVTHLVLCTEKPFVPLHAPATEYVEHLTEEEILIANTRAGATMYEWNPTSNDLKLLFAEIIDWLSPAPGKPATRNIALVAAAELAYTTLIRDVRTGLKIQQMCLGNFQFNPYTNNGLSAKEKMQKLRDSVSSFVVQGTIGSFKYFHSFGQVREMLIDSSRTGDAGRDTVQIETTSKSTKGKAKKLKKTGNNTLLAQVKDLQKQHGFGLLKFWVDSWKSTGTWSFVDENLALTPPGDAILLVGPILGVLRKDSTVQNASRPVTGTSIASKEDGDAEEDVEKNHTEMEMVWLPVLYEFDRPADVEIVVKNVFSASEQRFFFSFPGNRPVVIELGPFESGSRYTSIIVSGVRNVNSTNFVISTDYDAVSNNVAIINCCKVGDPKQQPCADFVQNVVDRTSVPFHGISCLLHVNVKIHSETLLDELLDIPNLENSIVESRRTGIITEACRLILETVVETIRADLRSVLSKPSYRQMLRCAYNLFMPTTRFTDTVQVTEKTNKESLTRLLRLMVTRVSQEYLEQLRFPGQNIFKMKESKVELPPTGTVVTDDGSMTMSKPGTASSRPATGPQGSRTGPSVVTDISSLTMGSVQSKVPPETEKEQVAPKPTSVMDYMMGSVKSLSTKASNLTKSKPSTPSESRPGTSATTATDALGEAEVDDDVNMDLIEEYTVFESPSDVDCIDAVYAQWINGMEACPIDWDPWVSSNNTTTIEVIRSPNVANLPTVYKQIDNCVIDKGTRILILDEIVNEILPEQPKPPGDSAGSGKFGKGAGIASAASSRAGSRVGTNSVVTKGSAKSSGSAGKGAPGYDPYAIKRVEATPIITSDVEELFNEDSNIGFKFQKRIQKWLYRRPDRAIVIICPSVRYGTMLKPLQRVSSGSIAIYTLDSVFRSNRIILDRMLKEKEKALLTVSSGGGSSKRVQERKRAEARERIEQMKKDFEAQARAQPKDGYIIVESKTDVIAVPDCLLDGDEDAEAMRRNKKAGALPALEPQKDHCVTNAHVRTIGSTLPGDDENFVDEATLSVGAFFDVVPSNMDYVTMPKWLRKFSPGTDGVFFQDDVLLVLRQDPDTQGVIRTLEDDTIYLGILQEYEKSRLSDLSRPANLREVDLSLPGVIEVFVKDIIEKIWDNVVPAHLKPKMVNLCDDFIRSYCLSRTLSTGDGSGQPLMTALSNGQEFAKRVQKALVIATTLKTCFKMKDMRKFQYILEYPEVIPFDEKANNSDLLVKFNRKFEWDLEAEKEAEEARKKAAAENFQQEEYESDMEELEKEEAEFERRRELAEEEAERKAEEAEKIANGEMEDPEKVAREEAVQKALEEKDDDSIKFDEDGNIIKKFVAPVAAFKEEEEAPRTDIVGGGTGKLEEEITKSFGYNKLTAAQLVEAAKQVQNAQTKHKVLINRSLRERLTFLSHFE